MTLYEFAGYPYEIANKQKSREASDTWMFTRDFARMTGGVTTSESSRYSTMALDQSVQRILLTLIVE